MGFGAGLDCATGPALPGWSLAFDTSPQAGDCAVGPYTAVMVDGALAAPIGCAAGPTFGVWHTADVTVTPGEVVLTVDGAVVLDAALPSGQDFEGFAGFTAATGSGAGDVHVRNVTVVDSTCVR